LLEESGYMTSKTSKEKPLFLVLNIYSHCYCNSSNTYTSTNNGSNKIGKLDNLYDNLTAEINTVTLILLH